MDWHMVTHSMHISNTDFVFSCTSGVDITVSIRLRDLFTSIHLCVYCLLCETSMSSIFCKNPRSH